MKKVLFLIHCIRNSGSSQRRAMDYEKYLLNAGIEPVFFSYTPPALYEIFTTASHGGQGLKRMIALARYYFVGGLIVLLRWVALLRVLLVARNVDAIFIQWLTPHVWFTYLLHKVNQRIAFDLDDAVFLIKPRACDYLASISSVVFAGSHFNLEHCLRLNPNCIFLPTPVPVDRFVAKNCSITRDKIIIGWIGSISTLRYIRPAVHALDQIAKIYPNVIFRIIGCGNRSDLIPAFEKMPLEIIDRVPYETVPSVVNEFDIGIMPLLSIEWDKGKCVGKALEYMAGGVPCVISKFGENNFAVQDGVNGFLADTDEEWVEKISALIDDVELRQRIGLGGRHTAMSVYSTEICADILIRNISEHLLRGASPDEQK